MFRTLITVASIAALLASLPTAAQDDRVVQMERHLDHVKVRLDLTDKQLRELKRIHEERRAEMHERIRGAH